MSNHVLEFDQIIRYDDGENGITVDATIGFSDNRVSIKAKLDTGASICIFERKYGEELGLEIESGLFQRVGTAVGSFNTYGFRVGLSVTGVELDSLVYFAQDPAIRRNVLGRHGWIEMVRLGIVDYDRKLYISRY